MGYSTRIELEAIKMKEDIVVIPATDKSCTDSATRPASFARAYSAAYISTSLSSCQPDPISQYIAIMT